MYKNVNKYMILLKYSLHPKMFDAIDFFKNVWPFVLLKKFK